MPVVVMKEKFLLEEKEDVGPKSFIVQEFYDYIKLKEQHETEDDMESYDKALYETLANEFNEAIKDVVVTKEDILEISNIEDELTNEDEEQEKINDSIFYMLVNGDNSKKIKDIEFTEDYIYFFGELYEYTFKNGKKILYVAHPEEGGAYFLYLLKDYFR